MIRKELDLSPSDSDEHGFHSEGHVLSLLRLVKHPSIVKLFASYVYQEKFSLVLEQAECDLEAFLCSPHRPIAMTSDDSIYQALQGLCSAVATFHRITSEEYGLELKGFHHDLKPQNILVRGSRFLLSDFGLSSLKGLNANSKTRSKDVLGFYISPEAGSVLNDFQHGKVGQSSDIWALGCILAVVATYMLKGSAGVINFEQKRKHTLNYWTTYTFHCGGNENPSVDLWLSYLESGATPEMIGMLSLVRDMLHINPDDRLSAQDVSRRMDYIATSSRFLELGQKFKSFERKVCNSFISVESARFDILGRAIGFHERNPSRMKFEFATEPRKNIDYFQTLVQQLDTYLDSGSQTTQPSKIPRVVRKGIADTMEHMWQMLDVPLRQDCEYALERSLRATQNFDLSTAPDQEMMSDPFYRRLTLLATTQTLTKYSDSNQLRNPQLQHAAESVKLLGLDINYHSTLAEIREDSPHGQKIVLVEWLEYDESWQEVAEELFARMESIAELLHRTNKSRILRSFDCIGFFHAKYRHSFGLLFDIPKPDLGINLGDCFTTLGHLLDSLKTQKLQPALGDIFCLAQTLATTVLDWHRLGWLHRRINPLNVLFIKKTLSWNTCMKDPYLIGFEYSRPNTQDALTSGPPDDKSQLDYCHPAYLRDNTRYRPEFDYYSLGLLLLELAYWRPLNAITSKFHGVDQSPEEMRKWLLKSPVEGLRVKVGECYQGAVKACLSFDVGTSDLKGRDLDLDTLKLFEGGVIGPLKLCYA